MNEALAYEWHRIRSVRSTYWFSGLAIGLSAAVSFFIAIGFSANDLASPQSGISSFLEASTLVVTAGGSLIVVPVLSAPFCAVMGAMAFGHEYRYGTIKQTLIAVPNRSALFAAKLLVLVGWVLATMVTVVLLDTLLGALFLSDFHLGTGSIRPIVDFILYSVGFAVAGLSLAALFRNLAGGLVAVLVYPYVIEPLAFNIIRYISIGRISRLADVLPAAAGRRTIFSPYEIFANPIDDSTGQHYQRVWDVAASTAVYWGGLALLTAVALALFLKRDA